MDMILFNIFYIEPDPHETYRWVIALVMANLTTLTMLMMYRKQKEEVGIQKPLCPCCQSELSDQSLVCNNCELDMSEDERLENGELECPACKESVNIDRTFCPNCGEYIVEKNPSLYSEDILAI